MAIVMLTMLFMPIWVKGNPDTEELVLLNSFNLTYTQGLVQEVVAQKSTIYISILALLSAGISIFSIFKYKNRLTQMKLGALNSVVALGTVLSCVIFITKGAAMLNPEIAGEYKIGFFLPVIALVFNSLANRFIRRDEKLVQSANRMR
jgi:glucan phosphoethanolaminetransferase (alkaline phosphatase superfamily)